MNACIPQSRDEVAETAPKISTIYIPLDKVGEVIGPKGKVINTIQQETGADIGVDDDGARGIVTIGAVEAWRMEEAKARSSRSSIRRRPSWARSTWAAS
jgi:polyribonucleotide nucleotidyltransferase